MATKDQFDSQPPVNLGGKPLALNSEHIAALHEIVAEHAQASLAQIASELERRCGVHVCEATIRRALRRRDRAAQGEATGVPDGR